jgi:DNA-binding response OmpR family regulator
MTLKVLVVDDDPMVRDVLTTLLGFDGLEISEAPDGATGLELAESIQPDVVLLDLILPGIDGFEVARGLRKRAPNARVVMLTARSRPEDELEGVAAGAHVYLMKPFSPLELLDAVGVSENGSSHV